MSTGIWLKGMRRVRLGKKPLFVEIYYMHHFHCLCLPMHGRIKLYNNGSPYPMESGGFSAGRRQGKALKPDGDTRGLAAVVTCRFIPQWPEDAARNAARCAQASACMPDGQLSPDDRMHGSFPARVHTVVYH